MHAKGLWTIHQRLAGFRVKVHEDHIGSRDHSLCGYMKNIEQTIRGIVTTANGMGRIDANRHPGQALHNRDMREINKVPVWIPHVGLHAAQTEYHP